MVTETFELGDKVRLKSGRPVMVVTGDTSGMGNLSRSFRVPRQWLSERNPLHLWTNSTRITRTLVGAFAIMFCFFAIVPKSHAQQGCQSIPWASITVIPTHMVGITCESAFLAPNNLWILDTGWYHDVDAHVCPTVAGDPIGKKENWPTRDDGANCVVINAPAHAFIYDNGAYANAGGDNSCPPGSTFDGANCLFFHAPNGTNAFILSNIFYISYQPACSYGTWDGAHCLMANTPSGGQALIIDGFIA